MTCEFTWPQHLMASDREAVQTIIAQHGFQDDVAYGNTKLFVRTPRTLFTLEQERATLIPILVLFLQKVRPPHTCPVRSHHLVTFDRLLSPHAPGRRVSNPRLQSAFGA